MMSREPDDQKARGEYLSNVTRLDDPIFEVPGVVVVAWHSLSAAVHIEWQSWANTKEFMAALDAGHRALLERRSSRWLADCRGMKAIQQADQDWLDQVWFPRMLAAGLKRMAVVMPRSVLASVNVRQILDRVPDTSLSTAYFATVEEAVPWLTRPPSA